MEVARNVGDEGIDIIPMYWGGHSLYCRKCERAEQIQGIYLPEAVRNYVDQGFAWLEVLGTGPNVGKRCSKSHAHAFKRARTLVDVAKVGDMILCPNRSPVGQGILLSPLVGKNITKSGFFDGEEFFVEESIPVAIYRQE